MATIISFQEYASRHGRPARLNAPVIGTVPFEDDLSFPPEILGNLARCGGSAAERERAGQVFRRFGMESEKVLAEPLMLDAAWALITQLYAELLAYRQQRGRRCAEGPYYEAVLRGDIRGATQLAKECGVEQRLISLVHDYLDEQMEYGTGPFRGGDARHNQAVGWVLKRATPGIASRSLEGLIETVRRHGPDEKMLSRLTPLLEKSGLRLLVLGDTPESVLFFIDWGLLAPRLHRSVVKTHWAQWARDVRGIDGRFRLLYPRDVPPELLKVASPG